MQCSAESCFLPELSSLSFDDSKNTWIYSTDPEKSLAYNPTMHTKHQNHHQGQEATLPLGIAAVVSEDLKLVPSCSDKDDLTDVRHEESEEQLTEAQELVAALERLELSCQSSREMVKATAER